jgi:hypothetical protein
VVVHAAAEAVLAMALAGPGGVLLVSAPGAAGQLGPGWWQALLLAAGAGSGVLDCADAPGQALAALRAGCRDLVLDGGCPGFAAVAGAAAEVGARLRPARPPTLDCARLDLRRPAARETLAAWLAQGPRDSGATPR